MSRALFTLYGLVLCLASACGVAEEDRHPDVLFLLLTHPAQSEST